MGDQQLDEREILEAARAIRDLGIRAKYLKQVCADAEVRQRLEQRLKHWRRWQFGLRSLFLVMVVAAVLSAFLGFSINSALRAQRLAEMERLRAMQAAQAAAAAQQAMQQLRTATEATKLQSGESQP